MNKILTLCKLVLINPNPGGLVANVTSKTKNCCDKFIIHKKVNKFVILHKPLALNVVEENFYQNYVLYDYQNVQIYVYFGVLCRCVQGGLQLILTSNPWVWKVAARRGEFLQIKILNLNLTFSQHKQFTV